ncbi:MAG: FumA C-terminus/TtdB family hydratase beta subunit [Oscillospiraceae bacterium]|jgi:fumarate hydratase subunit beta|nr:FumA C-terminus/TtdB family hydratase beta subunit [Oscillospiraceae bacterium]
MTNIDPKRIDTADLATCAPLLRAGENVLLSGTVYTARDAAHKKLVTLLSAGAPLPFDLNGACVYYAGPTPTPPGLPIGSAGPTTSERMDSYTPQLLHAGVRGLVGKGPRAQSVRDALCETGSVYFCALGGAGALAARCIVSCAELAFPELGCESIKRLVFRDFPVIVGCDSAGGTVF